MTEQESILLVEKFKESRLSQRTFCREEGVKRSTLRYWLNRVDEFAQGKEINFCEIVLGGDLKC